MTDQQPKTCGECRHLERSHPIGFCLWEPEPGQPCPISLKQMGVELLTIHSVCPCFEPKPTEADHGETS